jgi:hypothetical protein
LEGDSARQGIEKEIRKQENYGVSLEAKGWQEATHQPGFCAKDCNLVARLVVLAGSSQDDIKSDFRS